MSKEAMKLLVAEMQYVLDCINQEQMPFDGDDFHEALSLGRQAIEQQQERCVGCEACINSACGREDCPKCWKESASVAYIRGLEDGMSQAIEQAQKQEPVAWMKKMFSPELGEFFDYKDGAFARETDCQGWTPLYTSPPQRQPLTDEGLVKAAQSCLSPIQYDHFEALLENDPDAHNRLSRAIENERGK